MSSGGVAVAGERLASRVGGDVRGLLKRHQVPCGGAADLRRLGEFLFANAALRSDLFALCNSISHMADVDLTADELLGVVAEGYGPGLTVPEEVRGEFCAAYQGWAARELALELPDRSTGEVKGPAMQPSAAMTDVDQTLQRLSISSLELKMFLADVKQRVSEIDPELEHLERVVSQMKAEGRGTEALEGERVAGAKVAWAQVAGAQVAGAQVAGAQVEAARKPARRMWLAACGLAAALVVATGYGAWLARGYWDTRTATVRIVDGAGAESRPAAGAGPEAVSGARAVPKASWHGAAVVKPSAATPITRVLALPLRAMTPAIAKPMASKAGERAAVRVPAPIVRVDPNGAAATREKAGEPVFVPSSTMIGYALATPKPVYPAVSVPDEKEGRVEVRATISPAGEVVATQVVSGPVIFREAADRAMRNWRFRPYLVDGAPVQVSTTVAFVFRSMPAT